MRFIFDPILKFRTELVLLGYLNLSRTVLKQQTQGVNEGNTSSKIFKP